MRIDKHALIKYPAIVLLSLVITAFTSSRDSYSLSFITNISYTLVYWEGSWWITSLLRNRFNSYKQTGKRILWQFISITFYVAITNYLLCHYLVVALYNPKGSLLPIYLNTLWMSLFITYMITAVYEALNFFELWKKSIIESEQLKQENIQTQFEMLKSQVNPHFLFNSLNTLSAIIPEDQEKAVEFVQKLSSLYRFILQHRDQATVSLQTEIGGIYHYFYLQQMRFGQELSLQVKLTPDALLKQVPPLSLQILVENAVKHNMISSSKPLQITIENDGDTLLVTNNLQRKRSAEPGTQLGLSNLFDRYRLLGSAMPEITENPSFFTAKIPLISPNT